MQLPSRHTVQGCIGGESMATCVNVTDLGINPVYRARRLECLQFDHLGSSLTFNITCCVTVKMRFKPGLFFVSGRIV